MRYRTLGQSGIEASVVGLGAWVLGGGSVWGKDTDDAESVRTIHAALGAGINLIDTAPAYGFGRSEWVVGRAIKDRRDKVVLATKCGMLWDGDKGAFFIDFDGRKLYRCLRPESIREEVDQSLSRLDTDVIDLYQTHWPAMEPDLTPIAESMGCLMDLKSAGKIRAIGVSNVSLDELKENAAHGEVASIQPHYSMLAREIESDLLPWCLEQGVATLAYMPLEQGLLTGKVGMDRKFGEEEFRSNTEWNPWFKLENRRRILSLLAGWTDLTDKHGCTLAQLTIAWTVAQPGSTHALCGARRAGQAEDNAGAGDIELSGEELTRMGDDLAALGEPA